MPLTKLLDHKTINTGLFPYRGFAIIPALYGMTQNVVMGFPPVSVSVHVLLCLCMCVSVCTCVSVCVISVSVCCVREQSVICSNYNRSFRQLGDPQAELMLLKEN